MGRIFQLYNGIYLRGLGNLKDVGSPVETYSASIHAPLLTNSIVEI